MTATIGLREFDAVNELENLPARHLTHACRRRGTAPLLRRCGRSPRLKRNVEQIRSVLCAFDACRVPRVYPLLIKLSIASPGSVTHSGSIADHGLRHRESDLGRSSG
jgi:hypothetical protein